MATNVVKWQDIQIDDRAEWNNLKVLWNSGNYSAVITALQKAALQYKWNDAAHFNLLLDAIDELRQSASGGSFKDDAPITSVDAPSSPSADAIWFAVV